MALFGRWTVPPQVRRRLRKGERVLAQAPVAAAEGSGSALVATTRALHLPDGEAVPWEIIDRARWTGEALVFTEEGVGERVFPLEADRPGSEYRRLAETIAERVTATIVVSRHVPFPDADATTGFRLVARRPPGGSEITWQVHIDAGVDPQAPGLSDAVARALSVLRRQMGV